MAGENLLRGYWHNDTATAESVIDGCFHTGDFGELDSDGFLKITGRKKGLIVTAGGKNIVPAVLEDRLRSHPFISQCMVMGDAADWTEEGGQMTPSLKLKRSVVMQEFADAVKALYAAPTGSGG